MAFDLSSILQQYSAAQEGFNPRLTEFKEAQREREQKDLLFAKQIEAYNLKKKKDLDDQLVIDTATTYQETAQQLASGDPKQVMAAVDRWKALADKAKASEDPDDDKAMEQFMQIIGPGTMAPDWDQRSQVAHSLGKATLEKAYSLKLMDRPEPVDPSPNTYYDRTSGKIVTIDESQPGNDWSNLVKIPSSQKLEIAPDGEIGLAPEKGSPIAPKYQYLYDNKKKDAVFVNMNDPKFDPDRYEELPKIDNGGDLGLTPLYYMDQNEEIHVVQPSRTVPLEQMYPQIRDGAWKPTAMPSQQPNFKGQVKTEEKVAESNIVRLDTQLAAADSAIKNKAAMDRIIEVAGNTSAGELQPLADYAKGILVSFGAKIDSLDDSVQVEQAISQVQANYMKELGARGLTDADMKVLKETLPQLRTSPAARVRVANILKKMYDNTILDYLEMEEKLGSESRIKPSWYESEREAAIQRLSEEE